MARTPTPKTTTDPREEARTEARRVAAERRERELAEQEKILAEERRKSEAFDAAIAKGEPLTLTESAADEGNDPDNKENGDD